MKNYILSALIAVITLCGTLSASAQSYVTPNPAVLTPAATVLVQPGRNANGIIGSGPVSPYVTQVYTLVPAQNEVLNFDNNGVITGQQVQIVLTSSGTTSYSVAFNAGVTGASTIYTGTTTAISQNLFFYYNGTTFVELSRRRLGATTPVIVPYTVTTSTLPYATGASYFSFTPTANVNLAADNVAPAGTTMVILCISDGTGRTITFTTNFKTTTTVATSGAAGIVFPISFMSNGISWLEISRGAAESS